MNTEAISGDELFAMLVSVGIGLACWGGFYASCFRIHRFLGHQKSLWPRLVIPVLCGLVLYTILRKFAAEDVRYSAIYLTFYMALGGAWIGVAGTQIVKLAGLSPRDDWIERRNPASGFALAGAWLGITFSFAGANIGNGPGWWVVLFSGLLATGGLFALWGLLCRATGLNDAISIDRDVAAGLRAAGFFIGVGIILGNAVAGDWVSAAATVRDFGVRAWPVLILLAAAAAGEALSRSTTDRPLTSTLAAGLFPGLAYVGLAVLTLVFYPPPSP